MGMRTTGVAPGVVGAASASAYASLFPELQNAFDWIYPLLPIDYRAQTEPTVSGSQVNMSAFGNAPTDHSPYCLPPETPIGAQ